MTKEKSALTGLKIGVIGCGNMGKALVRGLVERSVYPQNVSVYDVDRQKVRELRKDTAVREAKSARACVSLADVVVLAVKPDVIPDSAAEIAGAIGRDTLVVSIAAGVPIARIEKAFGKPAAIVRAMPNMPALSGAGMSAFSPGRHAQGARHRRIAEALLGAIGETEQVPEKWLDLVTAVSGSGPAYFFLLAEKLIEAANGLGMKVDTAKKLVYQTALGSAKVMIETGQDPEDLIARVASKGGTTEAALKAFQKKGFGKIVHDAVRAAHRRAREISGGGK
ncbi:MAG: pyrroline-5-carboxylate reductase [Omnitrophica bacterium RIFCSPHIGHO2_02_FULL_63_14]|nr:MAG: pyrroline-5-carboxylate reductase [Omnitrophica bacterium RIFCSPHIGHO2_02_FULL_63_14]